MAVNQVSFGKIVKVNAPYEVAKQIEAMANGKPSKNSHLNNEVKTLFNDTAQGEAHTFFYDKKMAFILSGKEGIKYWNSRYDAIEQIQELKEQIKDRFVMERRKNKIWDNHRHYTYDLINKYGIDETITPLTQKNKVRILNIDA